MGVSIKNNYKWVILILVLLAVGIGVYRSPLGLRARMKVLKVFWGNNVEARSGEYLSESDQGTWELHDLNGKTWFFNTHDQVVLLNFWATWCPPCLKEMPSLQELYNDYGDRVKFVLVTDEDPEKVKRFLSKKRYTMPVFFPAEMPPTAILSRSFPTTYIIGKDGKIQVAETGAVNWNGPETRKTLDQLLAVQSTN